MRAFREWAPGEQLAAVQRHDAHAQAVAVAEEAQAPSTMWGRFPGCVVVPLDQYQRLVRAVARSVAEETEP